MALNSACLVSPVVHVLFSIVAEVDDNILH